MIVFLAFLSVVMMTTGASFASVSFIASLVCWAGALLNGFLFAHLQYRSFVSGVAFDHGLTVGALRAGFSDDMMDDMAVYIANPTIMPARGLFTARIDGQHALVIEGGASDGNIQTL